MKISFVGYVPQKETLRSGTVFENILYGAGAAEEAKVVEAAELACAHEFIVQLPQGYQTDLGEVAARLSGGQRQALSLIMATMQQSKILLLDEHTAALDPANSIGCDQIPCVTGWVMAIAAKVGHLANCGNQCLLIGLKQSRCQQWLYL